MSIIPPPLNHSRGLSIAQLVVSILGTSLSGIGIIVLALVMLISSSNGSANQQTYQQFPHLIWILLLLLLLNIPSLVSSIQSISGKLSRPTRGHGFLLSSLGLIAISVLYLLGREVVEKGVSSWLLAPFNLLLILVPVWWVVELGSLHLTPESAQRRWGTITMSVFITLPVILLVELFLLIILVLVGSLWLIGQPEFTPILQQLGSDFSFDPLSLQVPQIDILPILDQPGVIFAGFLIISLIIPLIEEALKPLAMWSLVKRNLTPSGGFIVGLLCGAAFTLVESAFSLSAADVPDWNFTVLGRAGTGLLHAFTAGLNGWALASTWQDGKHIRLAGMYTLTVLIHGAWNTFAILSGIAQIGTEWPWDSKPALTATAPWVLLGLALLMLVSLFGMNRFMLYREKVSRTPPLLPPSLDYTEIR